MLVQLIYISTIVGVTIDQIENYIDSARIRNLGAGLAGLLLIADKHYIHYIEGERTEVSSKYYDVSTSAHQSKCIILKFSEITKREFPDFIAEYAKLSDMAKSELSKLGPLDPEKITSATAMAYIRRVAAHHRVER